MMIEDVLNSKQLERQGYHENVIGRIATLDNMESAPQINPPSVESLPKQSPAELPQIAEGTIPLFRCWMTVNMNVH